MQLFSDHTPATLQAQDTAFLEEFLKEIPKLVIEERKIQEEREKHQHSLEAEQENEIDIAGPQPEDRDDNSLFANINKVFKGSELIGQIVRNRHASLNKSELSTLLKESAAAKIECNTSTSGKVRRCLIPNSALKNA
jgi:hypothetical protein